MYSQFFKLQYFLENSYFHNTGIRIVQCFEIEWLLIDVITSRRDNTIESPLTYRLYKGYHWRQLWRIQTIAYWQRG